MMFPNIYKAKNKAGEQARIKYATSRVMKAYNRNGLAIFLLANLLTGAINMSIKTLHMGDVAAMVVLTSYMAVLTVVALALDIYDVSIKL
jgi:phosphatidylinositol glycan class W